MPKKDYRLKLETQINIEYQEDLIAQVLDCSIVLKKLAEDPANSDSPAELADNPGVKIGYIFAYKFDLTEMDELAIYGEKSNNKFLKKMTDYFFIKNQEKLMCTDPFFVYLDKIFIEPEYRGRGYALEAILIFLDVFAQGYPMALHHEVQDDLKKKYGVQKGRKLMKKCASMLELQYYNKREKMFWAHFYATPIWFRKRFQEYPKKF